MVERNLRTAAPHESEDTFVKLTWCHVARQGVVALIANVFRVNAACNSDVGCALDNRPAVRKNSDLMVPAREPQRELVVAHAAKAREPQGKFRKIDGSMKLVYLHCITAA